MSFEIFSSSPLKSPHLDGCHKLNFGRNISHEGHLIQCELGECLQGGYHGDQKSSKTSPFIFEHNNKMLSLLSSGTSPVILAPKTDSAMRKGRLKFFPNFYRMRGDEFS